MKVACSANGTTTSAAARGRPGTIPSCRPSGEKITLDFEQTFMLYLPWICEHCLNRLRRLVSVRAIYKRAEDGRAMLETCGSPGRAV
jgi:nitrate reductase / nitrite oxidoreductase, beta subunit